MKKYLIVLTLLFILPFTVFADSYLTDSVAGSETTTLKTFLSIDDTISVINFESVDNINITGVDLSKDGDNSVIANVDYDTDLLTIQFKGKLVFPEDSSYLFYYFDAVKEINGLEYFDFRQTITLLSFFDNCFLRVSLFCVSYCLKKCEAPFFIRFKMHSFSPLIPGTQEKDSMLVVLIGYYLQSILHMTLESCWGGVGINAFRCAYTRTAIPSWHYRRIHICPLVLWGKIAFLRYYLAVVVGWRWVYSQFLTQKDLQKVPVLAFVG